MPLQSWQSQLVAIGDVTAIGGLAVATAFIHRMLENRLKMKPETIFWMIDLVKGLMLRIMLEDKTANEIDDPNSYV